MPEEHEKILAKKGSVAHYFISHLLQGYILTNFLDKWLRDKYGLSVEEILAKASSISEGKELEVAEASFAVLYVESIAYGIVETLSNTTSVFFISILNLIDKINAEIFTQNNPSRLKRYKVAYAKYSTEVKNRENLFRATIKTVLNSFGEQIEKSFSINPRKNTSEGIVNTLGIYFVLFTCLMRSIEDILNWVISLREEDINKIVSETHILAQKNQPEKEILSLIDSYGFGLKYLENIKRETRDIIKGIELKT